MHTEHPSCIRHAVRDAAYITIEVGMKLGPKEIFEIPHLETQGFLTEIGQKSRDDATDITGGGWSVCERDGLFAINSVDGGS